MTIIWIGRSTADSRGVARQTGKKTASELLFQKLKSNRDWEKQFRPIYKLFCAAVTVTTLAKHQELTAQRSNSSTKKCSKKQNEMLAYSKDSSY